MSQTALNAVFKDGITGPDSIVAASVQPIRSWVQGETFRARVHVRRQSSGLPMNLTGFTASMSFRLGGDGTTAPLVDLPGIIAAPLTGIIEFDFTTLHTKDLPNGTYLYDVWIQQTVGAANHNVLPASALFLAKSSKRHT